VADLYLLSPAWCAGKRAQMLMREASEMTLARDLREGRLTLGAAFSFMSGLYFRGKLAYASAFAAGSDLTWIITPTRGLQPPSLVVSVDLLREFATVDVDADDARYRAALERDAQALADRLEPDARLILLGSIATGKYVDVLRPIFGDQLYYPADFVSRGDMSRGGLMLRCVRESVPLRYVKVTSVRPRSARKVAPIRMLRLTRAPVITRTRGGTE
jgi:hypothetical protein